MVGYALARGGYEGVDRVSGQRAKGGGTRAVGRSSIFSGSTASIVGAAIGYVLAGASGQFMGDPAFALGFGVAHPAARRLWGAAAANRWTGTFLAGWVGDWTSQVVGQYAFPHLATGAHITIVLAGSTVLVPLPTLVAYAVGVALAGAIRMGGTFVAIGSTTDTARAGIVAGGVWLVALAVAAVVLVPPSSVPPVAAGLFGIAGAPANPPVGVTDLVIVAAFSLLFSTLAIPWLVRNQRNTLLQVGNDPAGRPREIIYKSRPAQYLAAGATSGAIFTILASFGSCVGLGNTFTSWTTFTETVGAGTGLGLLLSVVIGWRLGYNLTLTAMREIEARGLHKEPFDEMTRADPYLLGIGSMLFGIFAALSLTGVAFYAAERYTGAISSRALDAGLVGGLALAILVCAIFRQTARSSLDPFLRGAAPGPTVGAADPPRHLRP